MCLLLLFWKHQKDALVVTGIEERFWGSNIHSKSWEKQVHFQYLAGGSSHIFCIFIPNFGEMVRFEERIFQMGGNQPPTRYSLTCACVNLASESWIRSAVTPTWWWCFLRRDCLHSPRGRQGGGCLRWQPKDGSFRSWKEIDTSCCPNKWGLLTTYQVGWSFKVGEILLECPWKWS